MANLVSRINVGEHTTHVGAVSFGMLWKLNIYFVSVGSTLQLSYDVRQ